MLRKKILLNYLLFSCLGLLLMNVWVYIQQPGMIFYPYAKLVSTPKDWGLSYEDISLTTSDNVRLHGWYLPAKDAKQVILFFHGNAGNISHRGELLDLFHSLGLNALIIDYRGYGKSEGTMSEEGAYRDAMAAWQYLVNKRNFKPKNIIIFGRSLGGAVATKLATQVNEKALIIESTFSSAKDMAARMMPLVYKLFYIRYSFNTEKIINQVDSPLLLIHSPDDEVIPYELGEKIFAAAKSPKFYFEILGGHNDGFTLNNSEYKNALKWFIERED